jgi:putative protein kinase ArgK-like GTPase of G3E family
MTVSILTGPSGSGKSSMIKDLFNHYSKDGLGAPAIFIDESRSMDMPSGGTNMNDALDNIYNLFKKDIRV